MQRLAPVLIALLAAVALVTAAGSFDATGGPSLDGGDSLDDGSTPREDPAAGGERNGGPTNPEDVAGGSGGSATPSSGGGGLSWLVSTLLLGAIAVGLVLIVLLTSDDERAPERSEDGSESDSGQSGPPVDPGYGSPDDNAVVRAWRRFASRVDGVGASATPTETAAAARERGFPADAVGGLARHFRAVRYGRERPTAERERSADRLADRIEAVDRDYEVPDPDDDGSVDGDDGDGTDADDRGWNSAEDDEPTGGYPGGDRR